MPHTPRRFKLLVTDLDGTAVPMFPGGMPSDGVIKAIKAAQEKIQVSVATGRPYSMATNIIQALKITNLSIFHGGTQIRDPKTGEKLWSQPLTLELMDQICEKCAPYQFENEGDTPEIRTGAPKKGLFTGNQDMMVLMAFPPAEATRLVNTLSEIKDINVLQMHGWVPGTADVHITHIGASKRHALEVLLGRLNIEKHEVLAVGDSTNDLPLFEGSGFKVAMGNASDNLKEQADYITDTVGNDGLVQVIEKFIL